MLQAKRRLIAHAIEALLTRPVRADSQRGYLAAIANIFVGHRGIALDCKSVCASYLIHNPSSSGELLLLGRPNGRPEHCVVVDHLGRIVADSEPQGRIIGECYQFNSTGLKVSILARAPLKEMVKAITLDQFEAWVSKFSA